MGKIANEYEERWNFPNYIGSIDGKHIHIKQTRNIWSYFFNYKGTLSTLGAMDELVMEVFLRVAYCQKL